MAKSLIRTIDGWRFERPLTVALAVSTLFAVRVMPAPRYAGLPLVGQLPQVGGAILAAILLAAIGYVAMRRPARRPIRAEYAEYEAPAEPESAEASEPAPQSAVEPEPVLIVEEPAPAPRLRRADRHPDAPARAPIRASRDLGSPFMEVMTAPPGPTVVDLPLPPVPLEAITVARPEPVAGPEVETIAEATARADLGAMVDRLSSGLARRRADGGRRRPPETLRDALGELNRIAARRG